MVGETVYQNSLSYFETQRSLSGQTLGEDGQETIPSRGHSKCSGSEIGQGVVTLKKLMNSPSTHNTSRNSSYYFLRAAVFWALCSPQLCVLN